MSDLKFPLFIDLSGRKTAIFGGGSVALRRAATLLSFGAVVTVTAPQICAGLSALADTYPEQLHLQQRCFAPGDITDEFMVLAATDDPALNREITALGRRAGALANNASDRADTDFYFPAVAATDGLSVGICGTGEDHSAVAAAAAKIRRLLSEEETV